MFLQWMLIVNFLCTNLLNARERTFIIDKSRGIFLKDGEPFRYISGSLHYFRIPRIYWKDRLIKAKAAGLDAIQTYVPWNFHEPNPNEFIFYGNRDVFRFIKMAHDIGLLVLLRVGPYICAEWDFGGLPAWLLKKNASMILRSSDQEYLEPVLLWMNQLLVRIRSLLYSNGGPIIMIQMENEYGSYITCDNTYMTDLYDYARYLLGNDIILYTTDGNYGGLLKCGSSDRRYFATVDFGINDIKDIKNAFKELEAFQPNNPLVNSEFYTGWFDVWGKPHSSTPANLIANGIEQLLLYSNRVSLNMYMFHGGTNFGYSNGAIDSHFSDITSYDNDAPLSEAGDVTLKYMAIRDTIFKWKKQEPPPLPMNITRMAYGNVTLKQTTHILYQLVGGFNVLEPKVMEDFGQNQGFMVYSTSLKIFAMGEHNLTFNLFRDIGHIYVANNLYTDLIYQGSSAKAEHFGIKLEKENSILIILTENIGHINYGANMRGNVKGIIGSVKLDNMELTNWTQIKIDVRNIINPINCMRNSTFETAVESNDCINNLELFPTVGSIFSGTLSLSDELLVPKDTYAVLNGFYRGILIINSHIVGRFNNIMGPQLCLYVPASMLNIGDNDIKVIELTSQIGSNKNASDILSITFQKKIIWKSTIIKIPKNIL